jgi:hypothetical protein
VDYDSNGTLSMRAQTPSLASTIDDNPVFDSQEILSTVQLTQQDYQWLKLRHSLPASTVTNSREDMQKWMTVVLNLSEMCMMGVPGAVTFPTPIFLSPSPTKGNFSASPCDSVGASTLTSGQNDEVGRPDEETLLFESLTSSEETLLFESLTSSEETLLFESLMSSSGSMSDLSNL